MTIQEKKIVIHNVERYLDSIAETKNMELFFDFLKELKNIDAVKAAYINKTEEVMIQFLEEEQFIKD